MRGKVLIKCKCTKCNSLFDYVVEEDDPTILLDRNKEGLLETLCAKCTKETFHFGAWKPNE